MNGRAAAEVPAAGGTAGPARAPEPGPRRRQRVYAVLARNARLIALAAAAFLLTSALLLRFYVAGELAEIPARTERTLRLTDDSASYLDTGTWKTVRDVPVVRATEVQGGLAPGNPDWATWHLSTSVTSRGATLAYSDRRVIVDRTTGMAVNCCGEHVDGDRAVRQAGLVLPWPAGGTWQEYPFYDAGIRAAPPMVFDGYGEVAGLRVRRYVQRIDTTQIPDSARPVPARALGADASGTVTANRWLDLERTYWVEPVTGHVVDVREVRRETLRPETGDGRRTLLEADLRLADELVAAEAREAERQRMLLRAARAWLPAGLGAAGVLLLLLTAARAAVHTRRDGAAADGAAG
ncbi:DUF3068 domain-containing protein [Streptomonospora sp. PA3]|uniref:DUF3068 domain-containing protein n=1 Tax=Streptomonospora sp. PA3 TaxID=2607326 RepID=UPI0012DE1267|nr:DUF3068 domain-containing protein [Streptomonospora sp. PA3]MUL39996.1 DUF3068 domain-containing protein [Streptomonospora sp. PA3]